MRIVADENIPLLDAFFGGFGEIIRLPGRSITRADVVEADALLVRSVTPVDAALLADTAVRFVGTCTIGTDHLDLPALAAAGVTVASAPGCNARGVVEYVLSCLLTLEEQIGRPWRDRVVGIVGVGQVGSRLAATLDALGVACLRCDPPRAQRGEPGFVTLDALLAQADVVSLHVPLERSGPFPTWHLLDAERLSRMRPGTWLINTSRGPVLDNPALRRVLEQGAGLEVALDVWEGEPDVDAHLARLCRLATPHIAGYSLDGKLRGTEQIYRAFCAHIGCQPNLSLSALAPTRGAARLEVDADTPPAWLLAKALRLVYDVRDDDARFRRMLADAADRAMIRRGFDSLRKDYPLRRECDSLQLKLPAGFASRDLDMLEAAGLAVS